MTALQALSDPTRQRIVNQQRPRKRLTDAEQFLDRLSAHHCLEAGGTVLLIEFTELGFVFDHFALFDRRVARFDDNVGFEIEHGLEVTQ